MVDRWRWFFGKSLFGESLNHIQMLQGKEAHIGYLLYARCFGILSLSRRIDEPIDLREVQAFYPTAIGVLACIGVVEGFPYRFEYILQILV